MVKLNLYAIVVDDEDGMLEIKDLFETFEECLENRFKYANWGCDYGNIWIQKIPGGKNFNASDEWHIIPDGTITTHFELEK